MTRDEFRDLVDAINKKSDVMREYDRLTAENAQLRAELARMREALEIIAIGPNDPISKTQWRDIARAATLPAPPEVQS